MKKKILRISLVGKTNAGKSTLINNLVGEPISIVNKKINTTEELIIGILNIDNCQLVFFDTPGINFNKNKINPKLKRNLWEGLNNSDLIIYIIDSKKYNFKEIENNINKIKEVKKEILIVFNKNDLIEKKSILPKINEINKLLKIQNFFSISAKRKLGLKNLSNFLINKAYISDWLYNKDIITNKDDIFISNECTRNSILSLLNKELPYNINVINKSFKFLKNVDLKIKQEIKIDNIRYKKIILGKKGSKIKEIRIKSQNSISKILKNKIHLYIKLITKNA